MTIQGQDDNAWIGTFQLIASKDDPTPIGMLDCADCECVADCDPAATLLLGIDGDDNIDNTMNDHGSGLMCRNGLPDFGNNMCTLTNVNFVSQAASAGDKLTGQLFDQTAQKCDRSG